MSSGYLERVFWELRDESISEDTSERITFLENKRACESISSIETLKRLKRKLLPSYRNCLFWEDFKDENVLLLAEAGYGKTTEFQYRYEKDKEANEYTFFLSRFKFFRFES